VQALGRWIDRPESAPIEIRHFANIEALFVVFRHSSGVDR